MKKILITGSNGFIGKNLIKKINNNEYKVYKIDSKNTDLTNNENWLNLPKCNILIHLAAKTFVPKSWKEPDQFITNNLISTTNALEYCRKNNSKLILLSSYMYGEPKTIPTPEKHMIQINNPYSLSKYLSEYTAKFYSDFLEVNLVILRVFNVFGPFQPSNFLISQIMQQIISNKEIEVKSLLPKRDYLYVDDLISAIIKSIKYDGKHNIFNIGMGKSYSVSEVIKIMQEVLESNLIVKTKKESRKMEIMETVADINLAKKELGWEPNYSFKEGIKLLVKKLRI